MSSPAAVRPLIGRVASHVVALLLALLAGNAYWASHAASTEAIVAGIARKPLADATNLAFRFGSPEHARSLYAALQHAPSVAGFTDGDELSMELHLAALNAEYRSSAADAPHLAAASLACKRSGSPNCDPVRLKEAAAKFAQQRRD